MSAFLQSGRFYPGETPIFRVRFRPLADLPNFPAQGTLSICQERVAAMNWEAVGAISATVGVLGVIISLIYVASQIRQNSRAVQATTAHSLAMAIGSFLDPFLADAALARAWMTASSDMNAVEDRYKPAILIASLKYLHLAEDIYLQNQNGMIDSVTWEGWRNFCLNGRRIDCVNRVYVGKKAEFSKDFCTFFETGKATESSSLMGEIFNDNSAT